MSKKMVFKYLFLSLIFVFYACEQQAQEIEAVSLEPDLNTLPLQIPP